MRKLILLAFLILPACASVSFHQLDPTTLRVRAGTPEGHVYYLPRPYLWVALLPEAGAPAPRLPAAANIPAPQATAGAARRRGGAGGNARNRLPLTYAQVPIARGGAAGDAPSAPAPTLGASDQSFGMIVGSYVIKLVYMPDYSRPMSMSVRSGLFGVGSLEPTLQNGWMLTSFKSSVDNSSFSDVLTAVAGIMNTGLISGSGGDDAAGGGDSRDLAAAPANREVLRPGLYDFDFDPRTGRLIRLCAVNYFTADGMVRGDCG